MILLLLVMSAPLPFPKTPAIKMGVAYELEWHGGNYFASFKPNGTYEAFTLGGTMKWIGHWTIEKGELGVQEAYYTLGEVPPTEFPLRWKVKLSELCKEGSRIKLRRFK